MPREDAVTKKQVDRGHEQVSNHDGKTDLEESHKRDLVAMLFRHTGADDVCASTD